MFNASNVVTIKDFQREQKKREIKDKCIDALNSTINYFQNNREFVIGVAVPVFVGTTKIVSKAVSARTVRKEIDFKRRTIYDRSMGRYIELRKPLTTQQSLEIERRRSNGEKLNTILNDMKLLKK